MSKIDTGVMDRFLERLRQTQRSRGRQIILSIDEANELSTVIAQILSNQNDLMRQIIDLQNSSNVVEVSLQGGKFK